MKVTRFWRHWPSKTVGIPSTLGWFM